MTVTEARKQIKMKMIQHDIKSKDIVEALQVSPSLVSAFLSGKANMSLENTQKLHEFLATFEAEAGDK